MYVRACSVLLEMKKRCQYVDWIFYTFACVQGAESRAVMAEEQLAQLQRYIAQASITYQREIMRLRGVVSKLDLSGNAMRSMAAAATGLK